MLLVATVFYSNVTLMFQKFSKDVTVMLQLCYSDPAEMSLCYRDVTVMLQRCYGNVTIMLQ